jgi:hypothetical protein
MKAIMRLVPGENNRRRIYYERKSEVLPSGPEAGMILFDGRRVGNRYEGIAQSIFGSCGLQTFHVTGGVSKDERTVVLTGESPVLNSECGVVGKQAERLTFRYIELFNGNDNLLHYLPDQISSRMYLVEKSEGREMILDQSRDDHFPSGFFAGVLLNRDGSKIADVQGSNDAPKRIRLEFKYANTREKSRAVHYRLIADGYDSIYDGTFEARWERVEPEVSLPASFYYCKKECRMAPPEYDPSGDWWGFFTDIWEDFGAGRSYMRPEEGFVCVDAPREKLALIMAYLKTEGLAVKSVTSPNCTNMAFRVPTGFELWTIFQRKSGSVVG